VTAATDIVFGLGDPLQEIVHIDAQASADADKHLDVLAYNGLLHRLYRVPVHSILLLLRSKAAHSNQTGSITYQARPGRGKMDFGYEIVRLWERPVEALLAGGLSTLPLALLGRLPTGVSLEEGMRQVVEQVVERLQRDGAPEVVQRLLTATYILAGLRLPRDRAVAIFQGVRAMRESDTYQAILDEGEVRGVLRTVLRQGRKKLGEPDEPTLRAFRDINDLERLERLSDRLLEVGSWEELLQTP
jgi:hypothetical protein